MDNAANLIGRYLDSLGELSSDACQQALDPIERELIRRTLADCNGNQSEAAERLGIHRNTIRKRIQDLGL